MLWRIRVMFFLVDWENVRGSLNTNEGGGQSKEKLVGMHLEWVGKMGNFCVIPV
jgi:hypothetical protein